MVPEFGRAGRSVGYGWSAVATRRTMRAGRDVREEVGTLSFTPASLFVALVFPMLQPIAHPSGPPSSASSPFPYPYIEVAMVMIGFVGVVTFDKSGTGPTPILQAVIWVSPKRQLRNATLAPCCSYYASCAAAWGSWACTLGSQTPVITYRIPSHTRVSLPPSSRGLSRGPLCVVEWSRGRGA